MTIQRKKCAVAALVTSLAAATQVAVAQIPAFPGAQGPGATATGGRGGDVYHVTKLDFDLGGTIPGSLKYGINNAPASGRTIVFDVGGTIYQNGGGANFWFRAGKSNITVAGQTAPGAGITIAGVGSKWTENNVILRNITVRPNKDPVNPSSFTYDAFSLQLTNSIVDHVSASWYTDEGISLTDAGANSTVQYTTMGEGLAYAGHAFGSIIATEVDGAHYSYNHNLYAHNISRLPAIGSETGQTGAILSFSNNVIYNWQQTKAGYSATDQHSSSNFVGNYYITGANNGNLVFSGGDDDTSVGFTKIFQNKNDPLVANRSDYNKNGVRDGVAFGPGDSMPNGQKFYSGSQTFVSTPFEVNGVSVIDTADVALQRVAAYGGANWQNRNPIEQRIINGLTDGSGRIINDVASSPQSSEWATVLLHQANGGVAPFTRPANFDTDRDGMPDAWETSLGLNPNAANNNGDFDSDGYTDLEEYINELAEWPAPQPIVFTGATNSRYAQITNWDIKWQPSKYDTARITNGATAHVDAIGQHAGVLQVGEGGAGVLALDSGWVRVHTLLRVRETGAVQFNGGAIDLTGSAGIFDYLTTSPLPGLTTQLASGRNGGAWNGPGIHSSTAAAMPGTGIGIVEASELGVTSFAGQSVDSTTVLMRWTFEGDTDLNGMVDVADLGRLASHWQTSGDWFEGDFDYNGSIDVNDLGLLASNWQAGVENPLGPSLSEALAALGLPTVSVPEPILMGAFLLIPWSRKRPGRARCGQLG